MNSISSIHQNSYYFDIALKVSLAVTIVLGVLAAVSYQIPLGANALTYFSYATAGAGAITAALFTISCCLSLHNKETKIPKTLPTATLSKIISQAPEEKTQRSLTAFSFYEAVCKGDGDSFKRLVMTHKKDMPILLQEEISRTPPNGIGLVKPANESYSLFDVIVSQKDTTFISLVLSGIKEGDSALLEKLRCYELYKLLINENKQEFYNRILAYQKSKTVAFFFHENAKITLEKEDPDFETLFQKENTATMPILKVAFQKLGCEDFIAFLKDNDLLKLCSFSKELYPKLIKVSRSSTLIGVCEQLNKMEDRREALRLAVLANESNFLNHFYNKQHCAELFKILCEDTVTFDDKVKFFEVYLIRDLETLFTTPFQVDYEKSSHEGSFLHYLVIHERNRDFIKYVLEKSVKSRSAIVDQLSAKWSLQKIAKDMNDPVLTYMLGEFSAN